MVNQWDATGVLAVRRGGNPTAKNAENAKRSVSGAKGQSRFALGTVAAAA